MATRAGSITVPGDARGAVAVAAINVRTDGVESFSSHGPTLDGRAKPELGAPDDVMSRAYGSVSVATFLGTSAAAPHLGGAAALYTQMMPDATPDAILAFLTQHAATPQGTARGPNITGGGRLILGTPPGSDAKQASAPPTAAPPARVLPHPGRLFLDDFSSPVSGLPVKGYVGGGYRVTVNAGALVTLAYPTPLPAGDAVYTVRTTR